MEPARPDLTVQRVVERDDAHPDVVRHERGDHGFSRARRRSGVVQRVAETVGTEGPFSLQRRQVLQRLTRLDQHRQQRRIWSDDKLLA